MTCKRELGSVENELHKVLGRLTETDVRQATNKSKSLFYKASEHGHAQQLSFDDAIRLDQFLISIGEDPVFTSLAQILIDQTDDGLTIQPMHRMAAITKEVGEIAGSIHKGDNPEETLKEAYEARDEIQNLINDLTRTQRGFENVR